MVVTREAHWIPIDSLERGSGWFTIASRALSPVDGGRDPEVFESTGRPRFNVNQPFRNHLYPPLLACQLLRVNLREIFHNVFDGLALPGFGECVPALVDRAVGAFGMLQILKFVHGRTLGRDFCLTVGTGFVMTYEASCYVLVRYEPEWGPAYDVTLALRIRST